MFKSITSNLWTYIAIVVCFIGCDGARILAILPQASLSHQNTYRPIFRELAKRGHDITYATSLPVQDPPYKQIVVHDPVLENMAGQMDLFSIRNKTCFSHIFFMQTYGEQVMHSVLSNPEIQKLIHSKDLHFDLVFTESLLHIEASIAFAHRFGAPVIELQGYCPSVWTYHMIGNPYSLSYTVDYYTYSSDKMNFIERLLNTIKGTFALMLHRYYMLPRQEALADQYLKYPGCEERPSLVDMLSNISLVIQNTHIATHYPHPYNPNVIEMAGIQFQKPKQLPLDLQIYLDNSTEGVVYFSLGSLVRNSMMPETTRQNIMTAFRKLPYKVLVKWEENSMTDQPANVKISKWLPQTDVLAHPNVKAFITHGGLSSITETVYYGVPAIIIPLFFDQWKNAKQLEAAGNGIILVFDNITEQSITWSLTSVISDPSYREAAQRQSKIMRDNPQPPMERVMYWIEYVLRHKGAPHLRTAAASLSWYKYYLLDVILLLTSSIILILLAIYQALKLIYRCRHIFRRKKEKFNLKTTKKKT